MYERPAVGSYINRIAIIGCLAVFLAGCVQEDNLKPSIQTSFKVHIVWDDNPLPEWRSMGRKENAQAFALFGKGWCIIRAPKPKHIFDHRALEILGHELLHCTDWNYH